MARFLAVVMIHPAGLGGIPADGHRCTATTKASWTDSSARSISPNTRTRTATARPYSSRNTRSMAGACTAGMPASALGFLLKWAHLDRVSACPAGGGGPGQRGIEVGGLDHPEPADMLLALGNPDHGGRARRLQAAGEHPRPGGLQFRVEGGNVLELLLHLLGRRGR